MLYTSQNHLDALAWLNSTKSIKTLTNLQVQKFLYFYEMFQKVADKDYTLDSLKAYVNGPVFSKVYGDMVHNETEFINELEKIDPKHIDCENAEESLFLIESMTDTELSELTHVFDMWKSKRDKIDNGIKQIPIYEGDITEKDLDILSQLSFSRPEEFKKYHVIVMQDKRFVVSKEDYSALTEEHYNTMEVLSNNKNLLNPVYIKIEEDGGLLVD